MNSPDSKNEFFIIEYMVEMTCHSCTKGINELLKNNSMIKNFSINLENQQVLIETNLPCYEITSILEASGKNVVIRGITTSSSKMKDYGFGVCILQNNSSVFGVCRIYQVEDDKCYFSGSFDGMENNEQYKLCIHEFGDLSDNANSCGDIYHIKNSDQSGNLGIVYSNASGQCKIDAWNSSIKLWNIIGRSMVVHSVTSNSRILCGIIARSSAVSKNDKVICACDGLNVWEEKDRNEIMIGKSFAKL